MMGNQFTEFNASAAPGPVAPTLEPVNLASGEAAQKIGVAVSEVGVQLAAAKTRTDTRNDTVFRARAFTEFNKLVTDEQIRLQTEEDPTNPNLTKDFGLFLKDNFERIMGEHREVASSGDSIARLTVRLTGIQAKAAQTVAGAVTAAGRALVNQTFTENVGKIAIEAGTTGDIAAAYDQLDAEIEEVAQSTGTVQARADLRTGQATILTEVFNGRMEVLDVEGADAVLQFPGAQKALGAKAYRTLRNKVITELHSRDKGVREGKQALAKAAVVLGVPVDELSSKISAADYRQIAGLDRDGKPAPITSMATAVKLFKQVKGHTPNAKDLEVIQEQVLENKGLDLTGGDEQLFGPSLRGRSKAIVLSLSSQLAAGLLVPGSFEDRTLESAVLELQAPVQVGIHHLTKQPIFANGALPQSIEDAYKKAERVVPRPRRQIAGTAVGVGSGADRGAGSEATDTKPRDGIVTLFDGTKIDLNSNAPRPDQTLYGRLDKVTGIGSGVSAFAAESTIGSAMGFTAEEEIKARADLELFSTKVGNALSTDTNLRAVKARDDLIDQMKILPTFAEEGALRPRMFAVADLIISTIKKDAATLSAGSSPKQAQAAFAEMRNLNFLLAELGVPRLVRSRAEMENRDEFPVGTMIRTPSGNVGVIKGPEAEGDGQ